MPAKLLLPTLFLTNQFRTASLMSLLRATSPIPWRVAVNGSSVVFFLSNTSLTAPCVWLITSATEITAVPTVSINPFHNKINLRIPWFATALRPLPSRDDFPDIGLSGKYLLSSRSSHLFLPSRSAPIPSLVPWRIGERR